MGKKWEKKKKKKKIINKFVPNDSFLRNIQCKIDDKGRIKLPSSLVKLLQSSEDKNFVIKRAVFQNCLEVYPMQPWEKLMKR